MPPFLILGENHVSASGKIPVPNEHGLKIVRHRAALDRIIAGIRFGSASSDQRKHGIATHLYRSGLGCGHEHFHTVLVVPTVALSESKVGVYYGPTGVPWWTLPLKAQEEARMAAATISLPEARDQVADISRMLTSFATELIDDALRGESPQMTDELYIDAVKLLRAADRLLFGLRKQHHDPDTDWANIRASAQAVRMAVYLEIIHFKPDQAVYWSEETQARVAASDRALTPEIRAKIISETQQGANMCPERPDDLAARQAEDRLWDTVSGDGLDDR